MLGTGSMLNKHCRLIPLAVQHWSGVPNKTQTRMGGLKAEARKPNVADFRGDSTHTPEAWQPAEKVLCSGLAGSALLQVPCAHPGQLAEFSQSVLHMDSSQA